MLLAATALVTTMIGFSLGFLESWIIVVSFHHRGFPAGRTLMMLYMLSTNRIQQILRARLLDDNQYPATHDRVLLAFLFKKAFAGNFFRVARSATDQCIHRCVFQVKSICHGGVGYLAVDHVCPQFNFGVFLHGLFPALVGDLNRIRQGGVGQR